MTYDEAVASLNALVNYEQQRDANAMRRVQLSRMRRICQGLGDPQRYFRAVLVAGTNGKGSICEMLYSMLRQSGLPVGLYTSPHVEHLRERIRVWTDGPAAGERLKGDDWIREGEFAEAVEGLRPVLEHIRRTSPESPPTYFEALTAAAFLQFARRRVQVAVVEVGLGGRLDATNVLEPAIAVIGPIDVDHAEVLGVEAEAIAWEKAGIIKPNQTVITAAQRPEVAQVLRDVCEAYSVPLVAFGQDLTAQVHRHDLGGLEVMLTGLRGIYESVEIPLLGRHQSQNAALAVGALEALSAIGIPSGIVEQGLRLVECPGRIEVMHDAPLVLMDGAHNPHAAAALRETLTELCPGRKIHLLTGMSSDKAVEEIGKVLGELAVSVTCTKSRHPRALEPVALAKRLSPFCRDVHVISDPADAYTFVFNAASPEDVIVVTGSLFLVGQLRAALRHAHIRTRRAPRPEIAGVAA